MSSGGRRLVAAAVAAAALAGCVASGAGEATGSASAPAAEPSRIAESRQATGVKVGEVTPTGALVWVRVTERAARRADGVVRRGRPGRPEREAPDPRDLEGSAPGAPGRVRLLYGTDEAAVREAGAASETVRLIDWQTVSADRDFTHRFRLDGLAPATGYHFKTETSSPDGAVLHAPLHGRFRTAPPAGEPAGVTFAVVTCQAYRDADAADGFRAYGSIAGLDPDFLVMTGDAVYYDTDDPRATTVELARYHWHRIYGYPSLIDFHRRFAAYWMKDDHDTYANDAWPGLRLGAMGSLTFERGVELFREQVPVGEVPYRTFRWGEDLQIWLTEGREYRTPNPLPDGPGKTMWGAEQKEWLQRTLLASDAAWKVVITPTPIVGPDRLDRRDNHATPGFAREGGEIRAFFQRELPENLFVVTGDRHWQYHSVHPATGVHELSSGPVSDAHAGGSPGPNVAYHRFHREAGGFLSVSVSREGEERRITFRLHRVDGSVAYEHGRAQPALGSAG